ncbi:hypothetical protein WN51_11141 [Melipona quadrifasciata]|uniref:Uncharacterized protein n=1 Tax=Melipona quadrifasciata TaxID=166423 RepID=A0A0N0BI22_9HYME|nr:hypothetical protein WN51_11141 [Melipona quadrifasciata]
MCVCVFARAKFSQTVWQTNLADFRKGFVGLITSSDNVDYLIRECTRGKIIVTVKFEQCNI